MEQEQNLTLIAVARVQLDNGYVYFWDLTQSIDDLEKLGKRISRQVEVMRENKCATATSAQQPLEVQQ